MKDRRVLVLLVLSLIPSLLSSRGPAPRTIIPYMGVDMTRYIPAEWYEDDAIYVGGWTFNGTHVVALIKHPSIQYHYLIVVHDYVHEDTVTTTLDIVARNTTLEGTATGGSSVWLLNATAILYHAHYRNGTYFEYFFDYYDTDGTVIASQHFLVGADYLYSTYTFYNGGYVVSFYNTSTYEMIYTSWDDKTYVIPHVSVFVANGSLYVIADNDTLFMYNGTDFVQVTVITGLSDYSHTDGVQRQLHDYLVILRNYIYKRLVVLDGNYNVAGNLTESYNEGSLADGNVSIVEYYLTNDPLDRYLLYVVKQYHEDDGTWYLDKIGFRCVDPETNTTVKSFMTEIENLLGTEPLADDVINAIQSVHSFLLDGHSIYSMIFMYEQKDYLFVYDEDGDEWNVIYLKGSSVEEFDTDGDGYADSAVVDLRKWTSEEHIWEFWLLGRIVTVIHEIQQQELVKNTAVVAGITLAVAGGVIIAGILGHVFSAVGIGILGVGALIGFQQGLVPGILGTIGLSPTVIPLVRLRKNKR